MTISIKIITYSAVFWSIFQAEFEEKLNESILESYKNTTTTQSFLFPIISMDCYPKVLELANYFKPQLIDILQKNDDFLRKYYAESNYADEVSYEEFFIWIYHILYSDVTDRLHNSPRSFLATQKELKYKAF